MFEKVKIFEGLGGPYWAHSVRAFGQESKVEKHVVCEFYNDGEHLYLRDLPEETIKFDWVSYKHFRNSFGVNQGSRGFNLPDSHTLIFKHGGHNNETALVHLGMKYTDKFVWFIRFSVPKNQVVRVMETGVEARKVRMENYSPL